MSLDELTKTAQRRLEQYRDRWSSYGGQSGILAVSDKMAAKELREFEIFQEFDDRFLEKISPDVSVVSWQGDVVLFEQGTYLDLAFFVVEGEVEVYLDGVQEASASSQWQPIFDATRTQINKPPDLGADDAGDGEGTQLLSRTALTKIQESGSHEITFLATMDFDLPKGTVARLGAGELFGEIGAMSGWPQSVTARTAGECRLVQIRVPALRLMKRKSSELKKRLDHLYKERALRTQLKSTPLFKDLDDFYIEALKEMVELVSLEPGEMVVEEGKPADAVYLVRSGFIRLGQRFGDGNLAVTYLSKGMTLGEVELLIDDLDRWEVSASSVEYAELVKIPLEVIRKTVDGDPKIAQRFWRSAMARLKEIGQSRRHVGRSEFTQVALDSGLVQGNSILVIDLESCTRCDDCVRACAATHDDRPRFVREGSKVDNLLIAKSCYHCHDPVCLVGCPTGAIHRAGVGEVIDITDDICIGCGTCASNCPYDSIVMHDTDSIWPDDMLPAALRGTDRRVASKCDLCHDTGHSPACVSNCPQGCAYRVGSVDELQALLDRE